MANKKHLEANNAEKQHLLGVSKLFEDLIKHDNDINELLKSLAKHYNADRAYIFEISKDGKYVDNTYEWCKKGVSAEIDNLQNVPIESVELWIDEFKKSGAFYINSLDEDVEKSSLTYEYLEPQGIESLITAPLYKDGQISGFIGIDNPHKNTDDLLVLKTSAAIIYGDIRKNAAERNESEKTSSVISTMADDFDYISVTNLDTNEITRLRATDKFYGIERTIDRKLPANKRLDKLLKTIIHPDDWAMFLQNTKEEVIAQELEKGPIYKFEVRTVDPLRNNKVEYYRFKFAYQSDNKRMRVLGILNIDEQVNREM